MSDQEINELKSILVLSQSNNNAERSENEAKVKSIRNNDVVSVLFIPSPTILYSSNSSNF